METNLTLLANTIQIKRFKCENLNSGINCLGGVVYDKKGSKMTFTAYVSTGGKGHIGLCISEMFSYCAISSVYQIHGGLLHTTQHQWFNLYR